ncbi:MAG: threonine-phosphate decarboxylase CobD [Candidatus Entotheonellia bacterium]
MEQVHGGNIYEVAQRYKLRSEAIIDFSSNINPLGPSPRVLRALRSHLRWISRYPEVHAHGLVRDLARFHGLPEETIVVGNGSTALIYRLPYALLTKNALVLHPTFSEYERAFGLGGCRIDLVMRDEAGGFQPPWQRLFEALRRGYGVVILCNPNNPTGDVIAQEELTEFVEEAARLGTVVVVDEAFMDFQEDTTLKHEVLRRSNLIVLRSMTKCYALAGLRLGFLVASPPLAKRVREADEPWAVSALAQIAGRESLKDRNYLRRTLALIATERQYLVDRVADIPGLVVYPSVTNFLLLKITRPGWDAPRLQQSLIRQRILIRDCRSFPGLGGGFIRIAVRGRTDNSRLLNALQHTLDG